MKMLEDGLWSKFKFEKRSEHDEFSDLLLMTALKAKKLANPEEEYEIFEEFVFHNTDINPAAGQTSDRKKEAEETKGSKEKKESSKRHVEKEVQPLRGKFEKWEKNIFENYLCRKYGKKNED